MLTPSTAYSGSACSRIFSPLDHYDYGEVDPHCACFICVDWRFKLAEFQRATKAARGHPMNCRCGEFIAARTRSAYTCYWQAAKMQARSAYLAALNRRDLYCEASYHASRIDDHDNSFEPVVAQGGGVMAALLMNWLREQFRECTDGFWEASAPNIPLSVWFECFSQAVATSGICAPAPVRIASRP